MPWLGGGEAFAECEEESRVAFQANSSSEQRWNQALFLRDKPEPGSAIGRDVDVRSSHQAVLHFYGSVPDIDSHVAGLSAGEGEVESRVQSTRLIGLERRRHEGEQPSYRSWPEPARDRFYR